jgi:hypothetical protein
MRKKHISSVRKLQYFTLLFVVLFSTSGVTVYAETSGFDSEFAQQNGIQFYNRNAVDLCSASSGNLVSLGDLPADTLAKIKSANIDGLLAKTKDRYLYAQQQTGIPWQALAALHYREAGMNPNLSMADGQKLGDYTSVDGAQISSDANKDAALAAEHFAKLASSTYNVNIKDTANITVDALGKAFLAYNRGFMYEEYNKQTGMSLTYLDSPYVMNGFDESHMNMIWTAADSFGGVNSLAGKKDTNLGALTIYNYLVGSGGSVSAAAATSAGGCSSTAVYSDTCSVTAPIYGEGGNSHQLNASELTTLYGPAKSAANQVEVDFLGHKVQVNKDAAGCLQAVANEIKVKNVNYTIREIGGFRDSAGAGQVADGASYHQYGAAVDINASSNPCCSVAGHDMPQEYIDAFHHHGWSWGGNWSSLKDYMHFEFNGKSLQAGKV